jgi:NAD(P)-dependent dehydrogenase (short-subunit alcohol dehydrogenase family)
VLLFRSESEPAAADDADAIVVDVSDEEAVARASAAVVDRVDVLVNCHAALEWTSIEASTLDDWHESIRVNLLGPLVCTRALLPQLRRGRSPSVVHIGSIDGALGNPHVPAYSTAKGGLVPLTHVMAHELAAVPVVAATPLGRQALHIRDRRRRRLPRIRRRLVHHRDGAHRGRRPLRAHTGNDFHEVK